MTEMTPRERVLAAVNHQEPDRVPLDIGGGSSTGIVVEGYEKLQQHLGIHSDVTEMNKIFRVARTDERILQQLGSDCRPLGVKPPANWSLPAADPGTFIDIWGVTWKKAMYGEGCYYWELARSPLADATIEDLDRYPWPDPLDPGYTAGLADEAKSMYENTDYALIGDGGFKSLWELGYMLRGLEQMLMDLVLNPDFVSALLNKLLQLNIAATGRFLEAVGPYIQVIRTADDMASQQGLMMSPDTYRALIKPAYREYYEFIRSRTDAKIFYHSCGNVVELIEDLIDVGVDILNPVQVSAIGDTSGLNEIFGSRITFWGGIDTHTVLPNGSTEDVAEEVRRRITDLAPGGGYVVASVHNIQPDVSPENIIAMAEAVRTYGQYPLLRDE